MSVELKPEEKQEQITMEERLRTVGARIDNLVTKANETKTHMTEKVHGAKEISEEALDELKVAMDRAWHDVNQAWGEIKTGTEKAAQKLHSSHKDCDH